MLLGLCALSVLLTVPHAGGQHVALWARDNTNRHLRGWELLVPASRRAASPVGLGGFTAARLSPASPEDHARLRRIVMTPKSQIGL